MTPMEMALDTASMVGSNFEELAPAKLRDRLADAFIVIDAFNGRVDLAFLDAAELDHAISLASGYSLEGERDLRAMPRRSNAARLLIIYPEGWRTMYLVRPNAAAAVNAKGGAA